MKIYVDVSTEHFIHSSFSNFIYVFKVLNIFLLQ